MLERKRLFVVGGEREMRVEIGSPTILITLTGGSRFSYVLLPRGLLLPRNALQKGDGGLEDLLEESEHVVLEPHQALRRELRVQRVDIRHWKFRQSNDRY